MTLRSSPTGTIKVLVAGDTHGPSVRVSQGPATGDLEPVGAWGTGRRWVRLAGTKESPLCSPYTAQ